MKRPDAGAFPRTFFIITSTVENFWLEPGLGALSRRMMVGGYGELEENGER